MFFHYGLCLLINMQGHVMQMWNRNTYYPRKRTWSIEYDLIFILVSLDVTDMTSLVIYLAATRYPGPTFSSDLGGISPDSFTTVFAFLLVIRLTNKSVSQNQMKSDHVSAFPCRFRFSSNGSLFEGYISLQIRVASCCHRYNGCNEFELYTRYGYCSNN